MTFPRGRQYRVMSEEGWVHVSVGDSVMGTCFVSSYSSDMHYHEHVGVPNMSYST